MTIKSEITQNAVNAKVVENKIEVTILSHATYTGDGGVSNHGDLLGLDADDHAQYHNDARADVWIQTKSIADLGTKSHNDLTDTGTNTHAQIDTHIADTTGNPHAVNKTDVGLSNVTNDAQIPFTQKGAINGVAELDATGLVPTDQLPPSSSLELGETSTTAYRGDRGKTAFDHSQVTTGNPHNVGATEISDFDTEVSNNTSVVSNTAHKSNTSNPHSVTKTQVGLSNVPNIDTTSAVANDHTHTNKTELDKITDGDHDIRTDNPHGVTTAQIGAVATTGAETVAGVKTFSSFPVTPSTAPSTDYEVANKKYIDDAVIDSGSGDVTGPTGAVNNQIAVFDGISGKLLKDGGGSISELQPIDAHLTSIAGLVPGAEGQVITSDGLGAYQISNSSDVRSYLNVEDGAEVNNISDANATDLTDGLNSTLHHHDTDRDRTNHTGVQTASTISDFDTEVSNNTDVLANTTARHNAVTVSDSSEIDLTLTGQEISASINDGSIDETKLDASTNASLNLADTAIQTETDPVVGAISGIVKSNGAGVISSATAGTDYQAPLVADADYLTPGTAGATYEPIKGADDNFVTDAEKTVIGNTSGTNTGDQDISGIGTNATAISNIETKTDFISITQAVNLDTIESDTATNTAKVSADGSIKTHSDVSDSMTPTDGQVLTYDTTNGWQAETSATGVTDHTLLSNIGTNTHAQIDTHIADTSNPHSVGKADVGLSLVPNLDTTGAVTNDHTHTNKTILDATTASYTTTEETKLSGIETGATADQTDAQIKTAYEANANTNAFTDAEKTLLGNQSNTNTGDQTATTTATDTTNFNSNLSSADDTVQKALETLDELSGGSGSSPLTTKGDTYGYSTTDARVPVGTDGQVFTSDSTQALGVKWADPTGGDLGDIPTARYRSGVGQSADSTSDIAVQWDTEDFEDSEFTHDTSTNNSRVEVSTTGKFLLTGVVNYTGTTGNYRLTNRVSIKLNGTTTLSNYFDASYIRATTGANYSGVTFSIVLDLTAGDYFEVMTKRLSTASGNGTITSGTNMSVVHLTGATGADGADGADGAKGDQGNDGSAGTTLRVEKPSVDHSKQGFIGSYTAGEALALGDICYINSSGKMAKADANGTNTYPAIAMCTETIATDGTGDFLLYGIVRDDTWTLTPGTMYFLSTTAGGFTATAPTTTGDKVQQLGIALDADTLIFQPELTFIEHA